MLEKFLKQTSFQDNEDYREHLEFIVPERFNFAYDVMDAWAEECPDALALWWVNDKGDNRRISFGEMKELTDRTAAYFSSLGIGSGDMVMLILKRRLEFWLSVLALHKIGAITIPATHMLTSKDIVYRNRKAHIKAIVCVGDTYVLEQVEKASQQYAVNQILVSVGPEVPAGYHDWHAEWKDVPLPLNLQRVSGGTDTMLAYFTSGTSGEPKLVAHDYLYALGHLTTGVFWHHLHPGSIHLTVADTGWGKAAWGKLYGQWIAGAAVFVYDQERFDACRMMEAIERYRITSFCAPPTVYRFMVHEDMSRYDLSSLEHCTTAGEALNASVFDKFKAATGLSLYEGFGQTETTMTLGTMPWVTPKPGSMGLPNPQYDIDLIKPDGTSCQNGEQGEIIVRTDNVIPMGLFKGYYGDDALTRQVWHDGVYHTGDLAWRDEDGYYWFVGRTDDVIKSSGYRIGPFEVESALMTHPSVVECAVTGVPDPFRGHVVKATIVLKQEWKDKAGDVLVKELQEHVKKETAPYKYPRIVEFVEELPKTISGKIRRVEIRQQDESSYKDV
ncbi:MAG: AMP-binding protein [Bacteroidaceae bacterium]|nr:AMP-binding protein [Bacteroidaceae bacterium]